MSTAPRPKLLAFCDDPNKPTGFGRVAANLLKRWKSAGYFEEIWVHAINYAGFPHDLPYKIAPAALISMPQWNQKENLERLLLSLQLDNVGGTPGGFTHFWMMHDTFALNPLAQGLRHVASERDIQTSYYFPVDAPLEPDWMEIVASVDNPVAYCFYGEEQAKRALQANGSARCLKALARLKVLPHGVDGATYRPVDELDGLSLKDARRKMFGNHVTEEDFLILVVGQNQKRKAHHLAIQTLAILKAIAPEIRPRMHLHMNSRNAVEGVDLNLVAAQLGLKVGSEVFFADTFFTNGHAAMNEAQLNGVYNVADLLLTTSLGEGWGLPITEAMAAGLPVCGPRHSSVADLLGEREPEESRRGLLYETRGFDVIVGDNSRLRPRPDPQAAAEAILTAWQTPAESPLSLTSIHANAIRWVDCPELNWSDIAAEWMKLFTRV